MKKIIPLFLFALLFTACVSTGANRVKVGHILVTCPPDAPKNVVIKKWRRLKSAEMALKQKVTSFGQMAQEMSDCPTKDDGGLIGWINLDDPETAEKFPTQFLQVAGSLEVGQMSEVIRTKFGFHLIKSYGKE